MTKPGRRPAAVAAVVWLAAAVTVTAVTGPAQARLVRAPGRQQARAASRGTPGQVTPADVGGPLMASHGIVVRYQAAAIRRLPRVPASAFVVADAGSGQVLAAKDAHGLFPPASTLKVLTAITLCQPCLAVVDRAAVMT